MRLSAALPAVAQVRPEKAACAGGKRKGETAARCLHPRSIPRQCLPDKRALPLTRLAREAQWTWLSRLREHLLESKSGAGCGVSFWERVCGISSSPESKVHRGHRAGSHTWHKFCHSRVPARLLIQSESESALTLDRGKPLRACFACSKNSQVSLKEHVSGVAQTLQRWQTW